MDQFLFVSFLMRLTYSCFRLFYLHANLKFLSPILTCELVFNFPPSLEWSEVAQSCPTLRDPMDRSLPGSSTHGIFQARVLEWVAISFSRRSSPPRDWAWVFCIVDRRFTVWAHLILLILLICLPDLLFIHFIITEVHSPELWKLAVILKFPYLFHQISWKVVSSCAVSSTCYMPHPFLLSPF